jgi:DNA-binding response OmpR family regulator
MLEPELILLDLRLAGQLDGFDTCRAIRTRSAALVVIAAANVGVYDEVVSLAVGADHFLPAETSVEVVVARLRALLRRSRGAVLVEIAGDAPAASTAATNGHRSVRGNGRAPGTGGDRAGSRVRATSHVAPVPAQLALLNGEVAGGPTGCIVDGDLEIDPVSREAHVDGTEVALTRIEFDLLVTLAQQPRRVFTREQLMVSAWDEPFDGSHVLDAHLSRMRRKIADAGGQRVAHAVRGVGYRLRA